MSDSIIPASPSERDEFSFDYMSDAVVEEMRDMGISDVPVLDEHGDGSGSSTVRDKLRVERRRKRIISREVGSSDDGLIIVCDSNQT
jgi:hypothetical protein